MANITVTIRAGIVDQDPVHAKRRNTAAGTLPDAVQWVSGDGGRYAVYFPGESPFTGNRFETPTGFQQVRDNARVGLPPHRYNVETTAAVGGRVLADPDVIVD